MEPQKKARLIEALKFGFDNLKVSPNEDGTYKPLLDQLNFTNGNTVNPDHIPVISQ